MVRNLYKRLLTLYPQGFRERFGECMQQTFNDLYIVIHCGVQSAV